MSKTYHIHTSGCQMNVADSGHVAAQLEALGYQPVPKPDGADVIVVNTCVVRQSAGEAQTLSQAAARLAVTVRYGPLDALGRGARKTGEVSGFTLERLGRLLRRCGFQAPN